MITPVLAVRWWCCRIQAPWNWVWHPYVGVWILVGLIIVVYERAWHRRRPSAERTSDTGSDGAPPTARHRRHPALPERRRRTLFFLGGLFCLWAASDWPLGTLGASYLASVHMTDYLLYVLGAAPLLVVGIPEWMGRRLLERLRCYRAIRFATKPIVAGAIFNIALAVTHAPVTVDNLRTTPGGSFLLDMIWLGSGMLLWMPICSTLPELRIRNKALQAIYLWLAVGVVCTVPSAFLLYAKYPLYRSFELAPRVYGMTALHDQQLAGLIMKLGSMPVIWPIIIALFAKWFSQGRSHPPRLTYFPTPVTNDGPDTSLPSGE